MDETLRGETSTEQFQAMCWLLFLYQTLMHIDVMYYQSRGLKSLNQLFDKQNKSKDNIRYASIFLLEETVIYIYVSNF